MMGKALVVITALAIAKVAAVEDDAGTGIAAAPSYNWEEVASSVTGTRLDLSLRLFVRGRVSTLDACQVKCSLYVTCTGIDYTAATGVSSSLHLSHRRDPMASDDSEI